MGTLKIKNMVCDRCIMTVQEVLEDFGYNLNSVSLGKAEIEENPKRDELDKIDKKLRQKGFELIRENNQVLIEEIKAYLIDYLQQLEDQENPPKMSEYLSKKLHRNYSYLSNHFSKKEEITIEQHFINLKIERVKELLSYEELSLSQIAWKLNYSSVQYLSNQFKNVTGKTVTSFRKQIDMNDRKSLDAVQ